MFQNWWNKMKIEFNLILLNNIFNSNWDCDPIKQNETKQNKSIKTWQSKEIDWKPQTTLLRGKRQENLFDSSSVHLIGPEKITNHTNCHLVQCFFFYFFISRWQIETDFLLFFIVCFTSKWCDGGKRWCWWWRYIFPQILN